MVAELNRIERKRAGDEETPVKKVRKIHGINFGAMVAVAIMFDLFSFIPVISALVVIVSDIVFIIWFRLSGVHFSGLRILSIGVTTFGEAIPGVSALPLITANVLLNAYLD